MSSRLRLLGGIAGLVVSTAHAAGGTPAQQLPWPTRGEVLVYRSCGCADACWTAEVRHRATGAVRARLHCDCETLSYWSAASKREEPIGATCSAVNDQPDKAAAIRRLLIERRAPALPAGR